MTMPDSPISDAIANAFARFDATPRAFPEDMEELTKRVHFNPHLHPRLPDGRFAPKAGGKPHGDKLQPRGAKTKSKRFGSSRAAFAHALDHTQATGESMYVVQRRKRTKDHDPEWEVTPDKPPKGTPIEVSYHKKPKDDTAAPKAGGGRTLDSGPSGDDDWDYQDDDDDWGYQDGERVKVVGNPPNGAKGKGRVEGWTGRDDTFRVQLDDGRVVDLPMEHLQAADPRNDTRAMVRRQRTEQARLGQELKDEEGNAIGSPNDWSAGNRVVLRDGSYIGRDDQYPNALFIDEPSANMQYDVSPEDIFEFARTKQ